MISMFLPRTKLGEKSSSSGSIRHYKTKGNFENVWFYQFFPDPDPPGSKNYLISRIRIRNYYSRSKSRFCSGFSLFFYTKLNTMFLRGSKSGSEIINFKSGTLVFTPTHGRTRNGIIHIRQNQIRFGYARSRV